MEQPQQVPATSLHAIPQSSGIATPSNSNHNNHLFESFVSVDNYNNQAVIASQTSMIIDNNSNITQEDTILSNQEANTNTSNTDSLCMRGRHLLLSLSAKGWWGSLFLFWIFFNLFPLFMEAYFLRNNFIALSTPSSWYILSSLYHNTVVIFPPDVKPRLITIYENKKPVKKWVVDFSLSNVSNNSNVIMLKDTSSSFPKHQVLPHRSLQESISYNDNDDSVLLSQDNTRLLDASIIHTKGNNYDENKKVVWQSASSLLATRNNYSSLTQIQCNLLNEFLHLSTTYWELASDRPIKSVEPSALTSNILIGLWLLRACFPVVRMARSTLLKSNPNKTKFYTTCIELVAFISLSSLSLAFIGTELHVDGCIEWWAFGSDGAELFERQLSYWTINIVAAVILLGLACGVSCVVGQRNHSYYSSPVRRVNTTRRQRPVQQDTTSSSSLAQFDSTQNSNNNIHNQSRSILSSLFHTTNRNNNSNGTVSRHDENDYNHMSYACLLRFLRWLPRRQGTASCFLSGLNPIWPIAMFFFGSAFLPSIAVLVVGIEKPWILSLWLYIVIVLIDEYIRSCHSYINPNYNSTLSSLLSLRIAVATTTTNVRESGSLLSVSNNHYDNTSRQSLELLRYEDVDLSDLDTDTDNNGTIQKQKNNNNHNLFSKRNIRQQKEPTSNENDTKNNSRGNKGRKRDDVVYVEPSTDGSSLYNIHATPLTKFVDEQSEHECHNVKKSNILSSYTSSYLAASSSSSSPSFSNAEESPSIHIHHNNNNNNNNNVENRSPSSTDTPTTGAIESSSSASVLQNVYKDNNQTTILHPNMFILNEGEEKDNKALCNNNYNNSSSSSFNIISLNSTISLNTNNAALCIVCFEKIADVIAIPCCHGVLCIDCCRALIQQAVNLFNDSLVKSNYTANVIPHYFREGNIRNNENNTNNNGDSNNGRLNHRNFFNGNHLNSSLKLINFIHCPLCRTSTTMYYRIFPWGHPEGRAVCIWDVRFL